jgi:lipid-A-disaccharide synthase-like uncharacterized protein
MMKHGRSQFKNPLLIKYFTPIVLLDMLAAGGIIYTFTIEFGDPAGAGTGYMANLFMSILYIVFFFSTPAQKAWNIPVAIYKMLGTGTIALSILWTDKPNTYVFVLAVLVVFFDLLYIFMLKNRSFFTQENKQDWHA